MASRLMWENYYRTQEVILSSPSLHETVFKALPQAIRARFEQSKDPLKAFSDGVDVEKQRQSFIMKIGFIDPDPQAATQIVNLLVSLYIEDANRRLRDLKSGAAETLSKETLPSIRAKVDDADARLQEFQTQTGFIDFEEHYKSLTEARRRFDSRLTDLRLLRAKLSSDLAALSAYGNGDGVAGLFNPAFHTTRSLEPLALERARLASDLAKEEKLFKERHPRLIELREQLRLVESKIQEAVRGTLRSFESDLAKVEGEEKAIGVELTSTDKSMADAGRNLNAYRRLQGDLQGAKDLYAAYLRKHGETSATSGATLGSVRVIDSPKVPTQSYKPRILLNLGLGALLGMLCGTGTLFLMEQMSDKLQTAEEVEAFLGLEVLAVIPKLSAAGKAGSAPVILENAGPLPELESFRSLRSAVTSRLPDQPGCRIISILSANPSEGKSTVTANLARVMAMESKRVLILDADLRRPSQWSLLGTRTAGPDLEDVLLGRAPFQDAVQPTRLPGVWLLAARKEVGGAAELASSPALLDVLRKARETHDYVLIDSAPVLHISESAVVARQSDLGVLVVREGATSRRLVKSALRKLTQMGVRVAGTTFNASRDRGGRYGYYGYYS
jgi:capsular exopolysaccharide synthesis family protein